MTSNSSTQCWYIKRNMLDFTKLLFNNFATVNLACLLLAISFVEFTKPKTLLHWQNHLSRWLTGCGELQVIESPIAKLRMLLLSVALFISVVLHFIYHHKFNCNATRFHVSSKNSCHKYCHTVATKTYFP